MFVRKLDNIKQNFTITQCRNSRAHRLYIYEMSKREKADNWTIAIASWIHSYFDNVMTKFIVNGRCYTRGRVTRTKLGKHLQPVWLCVSSIKTGTRRLKRRTTKYNTSRRVTRLVPVFILETYNQTGYKCLPNFVQTPDPDGQRVSSTNTANNTTDA